MMGDNQMKKRIAMLLAAMLLSSCAIAQADEAHSHKICGGGLTSTCNHAGEAHSSDDVPWVAWDGTLGDNNWIPAQRTKEDVYYLYLTDDVYIDKTINVQGKVYLCLNGHKIIKTASQIDTGSDGYGSKDAIIYVLGYLCLTDCQPEGQQGSITHEEGKTGAGILCYGQMDMYGGRIADNSAGWVRGAGIHLAYSNSKFRMYGGSIEGNTTSQYDGGGIWINYGKAELYGGSIGQNHATDPANDSSKGGGICVSENGSLLIGGAGVTVSGNTAGASGSTTANNVYLSKGKIIKLADNFDAANSGPIGITYEGAEENPDEDTKYLFLDNGESGVTLDEVKCFVSDNPNYTTTVIDGKGYLVKGPLSFTIAYDLDGGKLPDGKTNRTTYTENDAFTLHNPEKEGFTFEGWTGTGLSAATKEVTIPKGSYGDRTYKATWKAIVIPPQPLSPEEALQAADLPKTGDHSGLAFWMTALLAAGSAAFVFRRKRV